MDLIPMFEWLDQVLSIVQANAAGILLVSIHHRRLLKGIKTASNAAIGTTGIIQRVSIHGPTAGSARGFQIMSDEVIFCNFSCPVCSHVMSWTFETYQFNIETSDFMCEGVCGMNYYIHPMALFLNKVVLEDE